MATFLGEMADAQMRLLEEFRGITGADEDIAEEYMEVNLWDLDQAVNAFFDGASSESSGGVQDSPVQVLDSAVPIGEQSPNDSNPSQDDSPGILKFLTWNVDGLDQANLGERTRAIVLFITHHKPDVVYLQEVIQETLAVYKKKLSKDYVCASGESFCPAYFNVILYNKSTIKQTDPTKGENFPGSQMGRHLLTLPVMCKERTKLLLMTSHFESTTKCATERKRQLQYVLGAITAQPERVLFAGDTNLRDKEVAAVGGLSHGVIDIWEELGKDPQTQYTWDVSENDNLEWPYPNKSRLRFDRVFLYKGKGENSLKPVTFELIGKERVPSCGRFPSDHWGIWCEFLLE